jgi:hypothetical protein
MEERVKRDGDIMFAGIRNYVISHNQRVDILTEIDLTQRVDITHCSRCISWVPQDISVVGGFPRY